ncbi:Crp/Fnr family transcriptional regulator [Belliella sp. DSM 111904]|uniref:Crp/Fnr family transcriptional regulator n=1 Tax=Belliella filtrata TaxID=2923435 RepID=A0ABS9UWM5_9BACT|nr:Crp/Fnr family transcriptional regulator [Belliella filtrata]MCH7408571.1 Crp/Fnr family transcriptional regulator [Belliella filtrata]
MTDSDIISNFLKSVDVKSNEKVFSEFQLVLKVLRYPKKQIVLKENQIGQFAYLIIEGAARSYYLHNGLEVHTWFSFEGEFIGSLRNHDGLPSRETVELLEDSILLSFDMMRIKELMKIFPEITNFIYPVINEYAQFLEDRLFYTHLKSAKEKYDALIAYQPQVLRRVPLTFIASYLGISRETLSRIRAK